jgi:phosphohistidine phosphatase
MRTQPDFFYTQSAVVPYRIRNDEPEILLITSRRRKRWIVPKGIVEFDLSAAESAAKEAWEEAGVQGTIATEPLGTYQYEKWGDVCTVTVFAMRVEQELEVWPEDFRERRWVSVKKAIKRVREDELKLLIGDLAVQLQHRTLE